MIRVLNLYAGIGGNRKLWDSCGAIEVTAVELNPKIAGVYAGFYPQDEVVVGDAHDYLLRHFQGFDFIWSSPPCPSHSVTNNFLHSQGLVRYPDLRLWQEIVFLEEWFKGKWVVENVKSYYEPIRKPYELDRHYFWANFRIDSFEVKRDFNIARTKATISQDFHSINLPPNTPNSRLLLRNCVYPPLGKHIWIAR